MKKIFITIVFGICGVFSLYSEKGVPELVFDQFDDEVILGIRLNLPEQIVKRIMDEYLHCASIEDFNGSQEMFNEKGKALKNNKDLAKYIIHQFHNQKLYIPDFVLKDNFLQKIQSFYYNGLVRCGSCVINKYWTQLNNMLCLFF